MIERLWGDCRYSLRSLLARPGFLTTVVLTLALGLGVNAAIFTLFHHVLMRPLPVPDADRLVNLRMPGPRDGWTTSNASGRGDSVMSYPMFRDLEQAQGTTITLAGHRLDSMNLSFRGQTTNVQGSLVTGRYFPVLGLMPALGRLLSPADDATPGRAEAVVLAHGFWLDRFGGDPQIVGKTVRINDLPMTVAGIAPEGFHGTTSGVRVQVFVPASVRWPDRPDSLPDHERRDAHWLYAFGRLAPDASVDDARAVLQGTYAAILNDVEAPLQDMDERTLAQFKQRQLIFDPGARGQSDAPAQMRTPLWTLMAVAGLVLVIACVNIANLQLARGASRGAEMAVRTAIGASAGRLRRQLLLESLLLAAAGALVALPVAWLTLKGLVGLLNTGDASLAPTGLSMATFAFVVASATAALLLFGLVPAWQQSRSAPIRALRAQTGQPGGSRASIRFRSGLAVVQIAFSLALLVLAGLFARSLDNIARVDLGMRVDALLTFGVSPALNGYSPERSQQLFRRMEDDLSALPGVEGVALSSVALVADNSWGSSLSVQGYEPRSAEDMHTFRNDVGPGFFRTLGIPLLAGRDFTRMDAPDAPQVAIVNQAFVDRFGLGADAIGKRVALSSGNPELDIEIVGVVADSTYSNVRDEAAAVLYMPVAQNATLGSIQVYVRSHLAPDAQGQAVRAAMAKLDADLPVLDLRTVSAQVRDNVATDRLVGVLSSGFAGLATLLAAIGLYGLLAYAVAQRTREMGLRMALGAKPGWVRGLVLKQVARLALVGIAIGLVLAVGLGSAAQSLLFGLPGHDPWVLLAATVLLSIVILAAAWWPAWRASRVDPIVALRYE